MTFEITFLDVNRGHSWTSLVTPFASQREADEYARKVCRGHARTGSYIVASPAVARPQHNEEAL